MRQITTDKEIYELYERVIYWADHFKRTLPEMRFFILDGIEFASLLEKKVYPTSPLNIWEGKKMVTKKHRIETGQESAIYYEVVQTGNPSYGYLNDGNSPCMQASVMAHVVGHCEFSELNVLQDSSYDRTEYVMHLVKKVDLSRQQMGERYYLDYWNACESCIPLIAVTSQFNLERSVDTDISMGAEVQIREVMGKEENRGLQPYSSTLSNLIKARVQNDIFEEDLSKKKRQQNLSRVGYTLRAPCQDILGFLRKYAPVSRGEKAILNYLYTTHMTHEFVMKTQIMNEGWAMYWEKTIMMELFKEKAIKGIIDYAKVFSGVCYPRPFFQRNPYHLGYHMWMHIQQLYQEGKVDLDYLEARDLETKETWNRSSNVEPVNRMETLIKTLTDYEFLRRFLTPHLVQELHLNRIDRRMAEQLQLDKRSIMKADRHYVWIYPEPVKEEMLRFFTHFGRPRIYIIDTTFSDGGLLLFHRDDGRDLRKDWIKPTLRNVNMIWKQGVYLLSKNILYSFKGGRYREASVTPIGFEQVRERMLKNEKPFNLE